MLFLPHLTHSEVDVEAFDETNGQTKTGYFGNHSTITDTVRT